MEQPRFRAKRLYALLLDQHFIAGLGNYLRSEILFDARLHPERKLSDLTNRERASLRVRPLNYQSGAAVMEALLERYKTPSAI